jgi:hypothetical protein
MSKVVIELEDDQLEAIVRNELIQQYKWAERDEIQDALLAVIEYFSTKEQFDEFCREHIR